MNYEIIKDVLYALPFSLLGFVIGYCLVYVLLRLR